MSAIAAADTTRIAEELSVCRKACNGCITLRGRLGSNATSSAADPRKRRDRRRVRSGRSCGTLCRPVFPAHLQNFSILLLLREAPGTSSLRVVLATSTEPLRDPQPGAAWREEAPRAAGVADRAHRARRGSAWRSLLALRGGAVPIIGGGDEPAPPFDFIVKPATAISTAPDADEATLSASADQVAQGITPAIDDLYTNAFLDPSNWRHDDYDEVFETFAPDCGRDGGAERGDPHAGRHRGRHLPDRRPRQERSCRTRCCSTPTARRRPPS
mgnify:CR=1 FL=1